MASQAGRNLQETYCSLQRIRFCLRFERDIRRAGCRLRLRTERRRAEKQYKSLLVGVYDPSQR